MKYKYLVPKSKMRRGVPLLGDDVTCMMQSKIHFESELVSPTTKLNESELVSPTMKLNESELVSPTTKLNESELVSPTTKLNESSLRVSPRL